MAAAIAWPYHEALGAWEAGETKGRQKKKKSQALWSVPGSGCAGLDRWMGGVGAGVGADEGSGVGEGAGAGVDAGVGVGVGALQVSVPIIG